MTLSVDDYERAIARIFDKNNTVIGAGFLVAPGYVLTCAHVVLQAIGIEREQFASYEGVPSEDITLDFHVLACNQPIKATVVDWLPYSLHSGDVAALKLLQPEPQEVKPIPLVEVERAAVENDRHSVYGFGNSDTGGRSDAYRPKSNVAGGRFQLCKFDNPNDETIKPGFSGSPVWNEPRQCVIGMVATASEAQEIAYAIPTQVLRCVLNKIKALCLDDMLTQHLNVCSDNYRPQLQLAISTALRHCNPNGVDCPWRDQLIDLSTDRAPAAGWETEGRLVKFAMMLVQMDGIQLNTLDLIEQWVANLCHLNYPVLLERIHREIKQQKISSSNICQHLMVVVEQQETSTEIDNLCVSIWAVEDRNTYNPYHPPLPTVSEKILTMAELPTFIREQIRNKFRKASKPTIHLFLPRSLFDCDLDVLPCGRAQTFLGSEYSVVVRTNLKTHPIGYHYYDDWNEKWECLEALFIAPARDVLEPVNCAQTEADLISEVIPIKGAMLQNVNSWQSVGELFNLFAEETALPLALWSRDPQFQDNLPDVLDCAVETLQDCIRQERRIAHESKSEKLLGHHLSLVWEDPKIVPPDMQFDPEAV